MGKATFTPSSPSESGTPAAGSNPSQPAQGGSEAGAQNNAQSAAVTGEVLTPALEAALAAIERKRQAADDKRAAAINQRVDTVLKAIQGLNLPQEQQAKIVEQAKKLAETDTLPNSQTADAGQARAASEEGNGQAAKPDPINAASWEIMDDEGIDIDENDPEAKMIDYTSKASARKTTLQAIEAKRKRQAVAATPLGGGSPAGRPAHFGRPPTETLDNYFSQFKG